MVLFQADKNKEPIQMSVQEMDGGASAQQKGEAAAMRTYINEGIKGRMNACLFKDLSFIVHSGDRKSTRKGIQPFRRPHKRIRPTSSSKITGSRTKYKTIESVSKKGDFCGDGASMPYKSPE